jgi:hypothetical protein
MATLEEEPNVVTYDDAMPGFGKTEQEQEAEAARLAAAEASSTTTTSSELQKQSQSWDLSQLLRLKVFFDTSYKIFSYMRSNATLAKETLKELLTIRTKLRSKTEKLGNEKIDPTLEAIDQKLKDFAGYIWNSRQEVNLESEITKFKELAKNKSLTQKLERYILFMIIHITFLGKYSLTNKELSKKFPNEKEWDKQVIRPLIQYLHKELQEDLRDDRKICLGLILKHLNEQQV